MKIRHATISKTGRRRNNEDAFTVIDLPDNNRFMGIVCDGMGGHSFGEIASETVCNTIADFWMKHICMQDCDSKVKRACKKASCAIDQKVYELHHAEMGTTMVMASIENDVATIAHIGDSRCYVQRPKEGLLYQTKDHIRHACGMEAIAKCFFSYRPDVAVPDIQQIKLKMGDRLLLCSDGLYKSIGIDILLAKMMEDKSLEEILAAYDLFCEKYGDDNYTAILIECI